ncbi:MAG: peptidase M15 [Clostridia bacterium]|nr:peptidase M15 [Clostridia bacterium]
MDLNAQIPGAPNFKWIEFIRSNTADRRGIDNTPRDQSVFSRIEYLADNVLQPLRNEFGPIKINSGYRSAALNRALGSNNKSFHAYGMAADIVPLAKGVTTKDLFVYIHDNLPYTELIAEDVPDGWVHVALERGREKEHQLKYKRVGGSVQRGTYEQILRMFA